MTDSLVSITLTEIEHAHLLTLLDQLAHLVQQPAGTAPTADPAIRRLTPDAYPDDAAAAAEFDRLTHSDLLGRRGTDAETVREHLRRIETPSRDTSGIVTYTIELDHDQLWTWARTLTSLRLVLAERLGVTGADLDQDDPRTSVYEWLGYRLELLITAAE